MSEATAPAPAAPSPTTPAAAPAPTESAAPKEAGKPAESATSPGLAAPRPDKSNYEKRVATAAENKKSAVAELRKHLEEKSGGKPAEEPEKPKGELRSEPKDKPAEKPAEGAQRAPDGKFAPKAGEPAKQAEKPAPAPQQAAPAPERTQETQTQLARAVRELNAVTSERETLKRTSQEQAKKLAEYEAREAARRKPDANPHDILDDYGFDLEKVVKGTVEAKYKPRAMRQELPADVREKLERLERAETERQQERQQAQFKERREKDVSAVKGHLTANAEQYPFSASLEWAAAAIVNNTYNAKQANAEPFLVAFEKTMAETTAELLGNERVLAAMLKSNPKLKDTLISTLGLSTSNVATPAASNRAGEDEDAGGPRSVSSLPSGQSAPPSTKQSKDQLKRQAVRELRQLKRRSDE